MRLFILLVVAFIVVHAIEYRFDSIVPTVFNGNATNRLKIIGRCAKTDLSGSIILSDRVLGIQCARPMWIFSLAELYRTNTYSKTQVIEIQEMESPLHNVLLNNATSVDPTDDDSPSRRRLLSLKEEEEQKQEFMTNARTMYQRVEQQTHQYLDHYRKLLTMTGDTADEQAAFDCHNDLQQSLTNTGLNRGPIDSAYVDSCTNIFRKASPGAHVFDAVLESIPIIGGAAEAADLYQLDNRVSNDEFRLTMQEYATAHLTDLYEATTKNLAGFEANQTQIDEVFKYKITLDEDAIANNTKTINAINESVFILGNWTFFKIRDLANNTRIEFGELEADFNESEVQIEDLAKFTKTNIVQIYQQMQTSLNFLADATLNLRIYIEQNADITSSYGSLLWDEIRGTTLNMRTANAFWADYASALQEEDVIPFLGTVLTLPEDDVSDPSSLRVEYATIDIMFLRNVTNEIDFLPYPQVEHYQYTFYASRDHAIRYANPYFDYHQLIRSWGDSNCVPPNQGTVTRDRLKSTQCRMWLQLSHERCLAPNRQFTLIGKDPRQITSPMCLNGDIDVLAEDQVYSSAIAFQPIISHDICKASLFSTPQFVIRTSDTTLNVNITQNVTACGHSPEDPNYPSDFETYLYAKLDSRALAKRFTWKANEAYASMVGSRPLGYETLGGNPPEPPLHPANLTRFAQGRPVTESMILYNLLSTQTSPIYSARPFPGAGQLVLSTFIESSQLQFQPHYPVSFDDISQVPVPKTEIVPAKTKIPPREGFVFIGEIDDPILYDVPRAAICLDEFLDGRMGGQCATCHLFDTSTTLLNRNAFDIHQAKWVRNGKSIPYKPSRCQANPSHYSRTRTTDVDGFPFCLNTAGIPPNSSSPAVEAASSPLSSLCDMMKDFQLERDEHDPTVLYIIPREWEQEFVIELPDQKFAFVHDISNCTAMKLLPAGVGGYTIEFTNLQPVDITLHIKIFSVSNGTVEGCGADEDVQIPRVGGLDYDVPPCEHMTIVISKYDGSNTLQICNIYTPDDVIKADNNERGLVGNVSETQIQFADNTGEAVARLQRSNDQLTQSVSVIFTYLIKAEEEDQNTISEYIAKTEAYNLTFYQRNFKDAINVSDYGMPQEVQDALDSMTNTVNNNNNIVTDDLESSRNKTAELDDLLDDVRADAAEAKIIAGNASVLAQFVRDNIAIQTDGTVRPFGAGFWDDVGEIGDLFGKSIAAGLGAIGNMLESVLNFFPVWLFVKLPALIGGCYVFYYEILYKRIINKGTNVVQQYTQLPSSIPMTRLSPPPTPTPGAPPSGPPTTSEAPTEGFTSDNVSIDHY